MKQIKYLLVILAFSIMVFFMLTWISTVDANGYQKFSVDKISSYQAAASTKQQASKQAEILLAFEKEKIKDDAQRELVFRYFDLWNNADSVILDQLITVEKDTGFEHGLKVVFKTHGPNAVPWLLERYQDAQPITKANICEMLQELNFKEVNEFLIGLLGNKSNVQKSHAAANAPLGYIHKRVCDYAYNALIYKIVNIAKIDLTPTLSTGAISPFHSIEKRDEQIAILKSFLCYNKNKWLTEWLHQNQSALSVIEDSSLKIKFRTILVVHKRDEIVQNLLETIQNSNTPRTANGLFHQAIIVLGKFRATEATALLASHIRYAPLGVSNDFSMKNVQNVFPCADALVKIGIPAIPVMISMIETSEDEITIKVCAAVINQILGNELSRELFSIRVNEQTNTKTKMNIEIAHNLLIKFPQRDQVSYLEQNLNLESLKDIDNRNNSINSLLDIIHDLNNSRDTHEPLHAAAKALGIYRARTAVSDLIDNLDYSPPEFIKTKVSIDPMKRYPCALALSSIGIPSLVELNNMIINEKGNVKVQNTTRRDIAAWTLSNMLGWELAIGHLNILEKEYTDNAAKERISAAKKFIVTNHK